MGNCTNSAEYKKYIAQKDRKKANQRVNDKYHKTARPPFSYQQYIKMNGPQKQNQPHSQGPHKHTHKKQTEQTDSMFNSNLQISLRRNSGIFKDPTCPINNQYIEDIDKELGPYEPQIMGIKGVKDSKWQKIKMINGGQSEWWYTGQWKNEAIHGVGSVYNMTENYLLVGLFIKGKIHQNNCRKIMGTGSYYIGQINQFYEAEGKGIIYYQDGSKYDGSFLGGIPNGTGKLITFENKFEGKFENGIKKFGTLNDQKGVYRGEFEDNMKNGKGIYIDKNGKQVSGIFKNNKLKKYQTENLPISHQFIG